MSVPNTFSDETLLRQALYNLLANDAELFTLMAEAALSASQWLVGSWTPAYVSPTQLTFPADLSQQYLVGRRVRVHLAGGHAYSHVAAVSYSAGTGLTTVTLGEAVLDSSLDEAALGILSPGATTALPHDAATKKFAQSVHSAAWREAFN